MPNKISHFAQSKVGYHNLVVTKTVFFKRKNIIVVRFKGEEK